MLIAPDQQAITNKSNIHTTQLCVRCDTGQHHIGRPRWIWRLIQWLKWTVYLRCHDWKYLANVEKAYKETDSKRVDKKEKKMERTKKIQKKKKWRERRRIIRKVRSTFAHIGFDEKLGTKFFFFFKKPAYTSTL